MPDFHEDIITETESPPYFLQKIQDQTIYENQIVRLELPDVYDPNNDEPIVSLLDLEVNEKAVSL